MLAQIKALYHIGVRRFYADGSLGVDMWAGEAVLGLKALPEYPGIELVCVIPFSGHDERWDGPSKRRFAKLVAGCDQKVTAGISDQKGAYKLRSEYIVNHAEFIIAVHDGAEEEHSSVCQAINLARKRKRDIILIHPDTAIATSESKS